GSIRGHLIEQAIFRSSANHANLVDAPSDQLFEIVEDQAIFETQALQDSADDASRASRRGLMSSCTELIDRGRHVGRPQERRMVRIHKTTKGGFTHGKLHQFGVVAGLSLGGPGLTAALQHPKPHYVLEEPRGSVDATFIGEIETQGFRGDDWSVQFCSQQGPSPGTEKCGSIARGNCGYGRTRVMSRRSDNRSPGQRRISRDAWQQGSDLCAWFHYSRQQVSGKLETLYQFGGPRAGHRIYELSCRCVCELTDSVSGQPVVE